MYKNISSIHNNESSSFAQSCVRFYLAVVSNICMKNGTPDDDLIDKLLETVFTVSEVKEQGVTRDLTPFLKSQNFDTIPVIRSYLLQLLLQNKGKESIKGHIALYFDKVEKIVNVTDPTCNVVTQIKLMYCQLYEVR
jgi:hypothetical protein